MKIKFLIIVILANFILISCTKVEVITDDYWPYFVSDFKGSASFIKFQAFFKGVRLKFTVEKLKDGNSVFSLPYSSDSDIYLLSPLLSQKIKDFSNADGNRIVYYFENKFDSKSNLTDNFVIIHKDRLESFYKAGKLLYSKIEGDFVLPVIYDIDNSSLKEEAESFIDGFNFNEVKKDILSFKIDNTDQELDIRNIFENNVVKKSKYLVVFSNNWKNLCFELAEKENKLIVTSDSWFYNSYESSIFFTIEDNIKGMLNLVYNSAKMKKLDDITLEGVILK